MKWEYYRLATVEAHLDDALHELGEDGWELVSIMPESRMFHGFQCFLKRPATGREGPRTNQLTVMKRHDRCLSRR